jgi:hypothetical protein
MMTTFQKEYLAAVTANDYRAALQLALDEVAKTCSLPFPDAELRDNARQMVNDALDAVTRITTAAVLKQGALDANEIYALVVIGRQLGIADAFAHAATLPTVEVLESEAHGAKPH